MRYRRVPELMCAAALLLIGVADLDAQEVDRPAPPEWYALNAADGRNHTVAACAVSMSGKTDSVYVIDAQSDRYEKGAENLAEGEYVIWKLTDQGQVIWKQGLGKMPPHNERPRPIAMVVPLTSPPDSTMVVGQFGRQGEWTVLRLDGEGKTVASIVHLQRGTELVSAVLLPEDKGLLLAGRSGGAGTVWNIDLDGNVQWKEVYLSKTDRAKNIVAKLSGIAVADESGGFVVAGDFGSSNKFGIGDATVWLMRCDARGKVVAEQEFPGRRPSICPTANSQFVVLYDSGMSMATDARIRAVDLELQTKWDVAASLNSLGVDMPVIAPMPTGLGFVVAGGNIKAEEAGILECQLCQFDGAGRLLAREAVPLARETILNVRVCCGNSAYFATRTKGMVPWDILEAGVFKCALENPQVK